jgi:hypothetical protein
VAIQQGWNQFTAAARQIIGSAVRGRASGTPRRRKRRNSRTSVTLATRGTRKRRKSGKVARLVKGSAAAKAWGRKMKRARKR